MATWYTAPTTRTEPMYSDPYFQPYGNLGVGTTVQRTTQGTYMGYPQTSQNYQWAELAQQRALAEQRNALDQSQQETMDDYYDAMAEYYQGLIGNQQEELEWQQERFGQEFPWQQNTWTQEFGENQRQYNTSMGENRRQFDIEQSLANRYYGLAEEQFGETRTQNRRQAALGTGQALMNYDQWRYSMPSRGQRTAAVGRLTGGGA